MVEFKNPMEFFSENQDLTRLSALFLFLFSILLYLIGIFYSRSGYRDYIAQYPDLSFFAIFNPVLIVAVFLMGITIVLFMVTRRELLLLASLVVMGIYLWDTNSMLVPNALVYDSYWHYSISAYILENNQFSTADITTLTFYLNYPFLGIFGAEFMQITGVSENSMIYYFPLFYTVIIVVILYAIAGLFFKNSIEIRTITVFAFIIGNASLHKHFAPQTMGFLIFALLFYLVFRYFENADEKIRTMMILMLFVITITHPLTSFILGMIFLALIFNTGISNNKTLSVSMVAIFFIFFFSWQIYWALITSTSFFQQLSLTVSEIFSRGLFSTGGTERSIQVQHFVPFFYYFRMMLHIIFIILATFGLIVFRRANYPRFLVILCFFAGPIVYILYTYFSFQSYLFERAIMFLYFPIFISLGYLFIEDKISGEPPRTILNRLKLDRSFDSMKIIGVFARSRRRLFNALIVILITTATLNFISFGMQERLGVVATEEHFAADFISDYDDGEMLCYQTNAVIYFNNLSENIYNNPALGWQYWSELHKGPADREVGSRPPVKYIIFTHKLNDYNINFENLENNLNNDTTLNRVYDNGFVIIYM
jgi:hypothetical protein